MTSVTIALLAGFLSSQQATTLSVHCIVHPREGGIEIECALMHSDPDGTMSAIQSTRSGPLKVERVPVAGLAAGWCAGVQSVMTFEKGTPT